MPREQRRAPRGKEVRVGEEQRSPCLISGRKENNQMEKTCGGRKRVAGPIPWWKKSMSPKTTEENENQVIGELKDLVLAILVVFL